MNNVIFERMKALMQETGADCGTGTLNQVELRGYAAGIGLVRRTLAALLEEALLQSEAGGRYYASLLHLDGSRYTLEELTSQVTARLAAAFAACTVEEWQAAFDAVGSGGYAFDTDPVTGARRIVFSNVAMEDLAELAKFIDAYTSPCFQVIYDGGGMTFAQWDAWARYFHTLDSLALPISILENLRSDMIEQHE